MIKPYIEIQKIINVPGSLTRPPIHLATSSNTPIQATGAKMAAKNTSVARPGLIHAQWVTLSFQCFKSVQFSCHFDLQCDVILMFGK